MAKAIREVKKKLKLVDIVLEIRDARVPLVSGNPTLQKELGQKRRLIVLNKTDLADPESIKKWEAWFKKTKEPHVFVNASNKRSLKKILASCQEMMKEKWATFTKKGIRHPPLRVMILGVPNTGKSTLINRMATRNSLKTGDRPGVTRSQEWIVLGKDAEMLDTPGIMPPKIENEEQGFWLCAIHAIRDEIVGKEKVAAFLVQYFLDVGSDKFFAKYGLEDRSLSVGEILEAIGIRLNCKKQDGLIDIAKVSNQVLLDFRKGQLGRCCFELPPEIPVDQEECNQPDEIKTEN